MLTSLKLVIPHAVKFVFSSIQAVLGLSVTHFSSYKLIFFSEFSSSLKEVESIFDVEALRNFFF